MWFKASSDPGLSVAGKRGLWLTVEYVIPPEVCRTWYVLHERQRKAE